MKILHLIKDHQVIERTLGIYESLFPGGNEVLLFCNQGQIKHLKKYSSSTLVTSSNVDIIASRYDFSDIKYVIAHYMSIDTIRFIRKIPVDIELTWEVYGADLYNQFLRHFGFPVYYENPSNYQDHYYLLRKYLRPVNYLINRFYTKSPILGEKDARRYFNEIVSRVNKLQYCCGNDARLIEQYSGKKFPSYEIFNYSLHEVLGELYDCPFNQGNNILVGNSSSMTNNHLYSLGYLKGKLVSIDKVILPLSYGGTKRYVKKVSKEYHRVFGEKVTTLLSYIPLHEYNKMLTGLKAIVLSSWRQESQGTAIMGFYMGAKVFMSEKSPLYAWFKEIGFVVFPLETSTEKDFEERLANGDMKNNRDLVVNYYNEEAFEKTLRSHFNLS